jgi:hypothetical protein
MDERPVEGVHEIQIVSDARSVVPPWDLERRQKPGPIGEGERSRGSSPSRDRSLNRCAPLLGVERTVPIAHGAVRYL